MVSWTRACSEYGREIIEEGGSAVDAVITVVLCTGVVHLQSDGLGGYVVVVVVCCCCILLISCMNDS